MNESMTQSINLQWIEQLCYCCVERLNFPGIQRFLASTVEITNKEEILMYHTDDTVFTTYFMCLYIKKQEISHISLNVYLHQYSRVSQDKNSSSVHFWKALQSTFKSISCFV